MGVCSPVGRGMLMLLCLGALWWRSWQVEQRWQGYRKMATARGQSLSLPADPPPMLPEENFASEPPFALIPVNEDGNPIQPPFLPTEWVPKDLLPDLSQAKRPDFAAERAKLKVTSKQDADVARAVLKLCDEQLSTQWARVLAAEAKPKARFAVHDLAGEARVGRTPGRGFA